MFITVQDLLTYLSRAEIDQKDEVTIRVLDDHRNDLWVGCYIDNIRIDTKDDNPDNMESPVEIVVMVP